MATAQHLPINERSSRRQRRSIVGPLILIALGALFLAQNFGLVSGEIWLDIWRLWPLLLILVGVELVVGRSGWVGTAIVAAVVLLAVTVVAWSIVGPATSGSGSRWLGGGAPISDRFVEERGDVQQATFDLSHGAGSLSVSALPIDSGQLIEADLRHREDAPIEKRVERQGEMTAVYLSAPSDGFFLGPVDLRQDWTVRLSPAVETELRVLSGASDLDLNLRDLKVTRLDVQTGASKVRVVLPEAAGQTTATIRAGATGIDVWVPEGVAAQIRTQGGLTGTEIDETRFPKTGDYYQSPDYDKATNRVALYVDSGVSGVTIR